ncbi:glycosyltransferase family protein [Algoriphagus sp. SE2]|uniref:glycosyltransferase family protein n=1 Tax=Algoriphagus sp. SE2 TaxID=3141536 RepID=UPI0031CD610D
MKFLFIIQGEGRGHMTQAIAFSALLRQNGHQLCGVIVGKSKRRTIPDFFIREIGTKVWAVESPNFVADKSQKRILIGKTILHNIKNAPTFIKSLNQIHQLVKEKNPDIILNFYDLLGGFYNLFYQPSASYWVIGHQYLIEHPKFTFAKSKAFAKQCFQLNTWLTAMGAEKKLALSFQKMTESKDPKLKVVPPLLRSEVKRLKVTSGDFFLAYMVNSGYAEEIISFAEKHPEIKIKAYWDKKNAKETEYPLPNLSLHRVHDQRFLQDMASCKGLVCTAGFESVCEAMYLGKPVMVIPVKGQYEQACNALDTENSRIGITSETFDFLKLEGLIQSGFTSPKEIKKWNNSWSEILQKVLPETKMTESAFQQTQSFSL